MTCDRAPAIAAETKVVADTFADQANQLNDPSKAQDARTFARAMSAQYDLDNEKLGPSQP